MGSSVRLLFWLSVLIVAAALALFAISNGETVALGFWPAPYLVEAPLYAAVLVALLLGFLLGEFAAWLAAGRWRREARRRARLARSRAARDTSPACAGRPARIADDTPLDQACRAPRLLNSFPN